VTSERPTLPTRVGHAEWGDNHFRGCSVARDLAGFESTTGLLVLAIAGRRLDENERLMLDDVATVTNVADPRVWPLKLARVASAYGGCLAAMAAATACLDGALIGQESSTRAAEILVRLQSAVVADGADAAKADDGAFEEHCRRLFGGQGRPVGFVVPFRPRDERVEMLTERVAARGRGELVYWRLFANLAETVWRIKNLRPNMTIAAAAVCLDMAFTPAQIGPLMTAVGASAFWANAFEGAQQAPACLQTLPTDCVCYVGPPARVSARAADALSK
jgi:hypothetical protein